MSEASQRRELQDLMERPRGKRMVIGVVWRLVMAAALLTLCVLGVLSCLGDAAVPQGSLQVSHCRKDQWSSYYICSGTLRTAPGGHILTRDVSVEDYQHAPGSVFAVSYERGYRGVFDLDPDASKAFWLAWRDGLIAVTFGVCGLMAMGNALRRVRPDLAWLRPKTKQWGRLSAATVLPAVLCAIASLACAVIAYA